MINLTAKIREKLIAHVWDRDYSQAPTWQKYLIAMLRIGYLAVRDLFFDAQLNLRAMSLVYTTLLSLVPLIAVSVSVLKGFGAHSHIEPTLQSFLAPLGARGEEITATIIKFVEGINSGLLGTFGLVLLLYTVVSLMQKIESAFNFTWHVSEERSFARRFSDYLSVILIGPVLVFTAIGLTASLTNSAIYQALIKYEFFSSIVGVFELAIPYMLIILAFTLLYIFIPNTKVKLGSALVGALVAGIAWQTIGWLFASFVSKANYTQIYSAFAALFFFMIWLYISWLTILIGACIAFYYQNPEYRSRNQRKFSLSNRMKEKAALMAMVRVAEAYYRQQHAPVVSELVQYLNVSSESLAPVIKSLINSGLLLRTDADPCGLVPGKAPDAMKLGEILNAVRQAEEDDVVKMTHLPAAGKVEDIFAKYQQAARDALDDLVLKDLLDRVE